MALWVDDNLSENERWWSMSPEATTCLIELWLYCRRAKNNGAIQTTRLQRASNHYNDVVRTELEANGWLHIDGTGCGTDFCPQGIPGVSIMHDYLQHQESAKDQTIRVERRREAGKLGSHRRWHRDAGVHDPSCKFCLYGEPDDN